MLMMMYSRKFLYPPAPFALISIRNPIARKRVSNIPMLLDTGADVSLLPTQFVQNFGFTFGKPQELLGFDEKADFFQTIEAQIIFLSKRFTGEYCLIDQDYGILGRDVLNRFSLVFDGKNLEWREEE
jgi:hypothetical protein